MYKQVLKQATNKSLSSSPIVADHRRSKSTTLSPWDTPPLIAKPKTCVFGKNLQKKVLVLDLDETLVYCRKDSRKPGMRRVKAGDAVQYMDVSLRPGVERFLDEMVKIYTIAMYTTASKDYADSLLIETGLKKYFAASLYRTSCKQEKDGKLIKSLAIFGVSMKNILLIDDSLAHYDNQPNNFLHIKRFTGNHDDRELEQLIPFLKKLAEEDDVRSVSEKYAKFCNKPQLTTKLSTEVASLPDQQCSQRELMISKEKSNKTTEHLSQLTTTFKESIDIRNDEFPCGNESENYDENVNENLESKEYNRDDNFTIFELTKTRSEPSRRTYFQNVSMKEECLSPYSCVTKFGGSIGGISPLAGSDDNADFDTDEIMSVESEGKEEISVVLKMKPLGSIFTRMKKNSAIS